MFEDKQPLWSRSVAVALAMSLGGAAACPIENSDSLVAQARLARDRGDVRSAVLQLEKVLHKDTGHRGAQVLLAELNLELGHLAAAERHARGAQYSLNDSGIDSGAITLVLGRALLMQGKFETLLAEVHAVAAPPQRYAILALRAQALLGQGNIAAAREQCLRALKWQPECAPALACLARAAMVEQQEDTAQELLSRALLASPGDPDALRCQAELLRRRGKPAAAVAVLRKNLAQHPYSTHTLLDIAHIDMDNGRFDASLESISLAALGSGALPCILQALALLEYRKENLSGALCAVQAVLSGAPAWQPALLLSGTLHALLGDRQRAEQHTGAFLAARPHHAYAATLLSAIRLRAGAPDAALGLLRPAIDAAPQASELPGQMTQARLVFQRTGLAGGPVCALQTVFADHGRPAAAPVPVCESDLAVAEVERAHTMHEGSAHAIVQIMAQLRAYARQQATAAVLDLEQRADNPLLQNLKGEIFLGLHQARQARASFNRALLQDPLFLPALANLARLDLAEGRPDDARQRYLAALAAAPGHRPLMQALSGLALARGHLVEARTWVELAAPALPYDEAARPVPGHGAALPRFRAHARTGSARAQ